MNKNLTRKRKTKNPCYVCGMSMENCFCSEVEQIEVNTRLLLVVHSKELKRTTNTGRLAVHSLGNSQLLVRGEMGNPLNLSPFLNGEYESLLLFPSKEAEELTPEVLKRFRRPIQLIVPDGNWRQASKLEIRQKEISHLPKVMIKEKNEAAFHLRKENSIYGMSTLEAIAKAMGILEGKDVEQRLQHLYQLKLQRTLKGRGIKIENRY